VTVVPEYPIDRWSRAAQPRPRLPMRGEFADRQRQVPPPRLRPVTIVVALSLFTGLALLASLQSATKMIYRGTPVRWSTLVAGTLLDWYTCAAFFPLLFMIVRRFPLERGRIVMSVAAHVLGAAGATVGKYALYLPLYRLLIGPNRFTLPDILAFGAIGEFMVLLVDAAVMHAMLYYWRVGDLRARLSEVQLAALRAQLHPHFLFNTLNGIAALVHRDAEAADDALVELAELLRAVTTPRVDEEVTLRHELELLERYLAIVRRRFQDRLRVELAVPEALGDVLVPFFILQPLVENAIEHGIGREPGAGAVRIEASASLTTLRLAVSDDGPGPTRDERDGGIGLAASRQRLEELYGARQRLTLRAARVGGATVICEIPLRRAGTARVAEDA